MTPVYTKKIDLQTRKTDIKTLKIYELSDDIFRIVIASF